MTNLAECQHILKQTTTEHTQRTHEFTQGTPAKEHAKKTNARNARRACTEKQHAEMHTSLPLFLVSRNKLLNFRESLHADVSECFENKNRQPHVVHRWCPRGTWRDTQSPSRRRQPVSCWSSLVRCGAVLRTILPHVVVRISGMSVRGYWPLRRPATMSREVAISTPRLSTTCQHVSVEDVVVASFTVAPIVERFRRAFSYTSSPVTWMRWRLSHGVVNLHTRMTRTFP